MIIMNSLGMITMSDVFGLASVHYGAGNNTQLSTHNRDYVSNKRRLYKEINTNKQSEKVLTFWS